MRVLAADDDPGILDTLERCLRAWSYDPVIVADGAVAWRELKRADAPRIVLLDWDMPGLSGVEVCQLLRSTPHGSEVYVVVLTARHEKDDLIEALEAGADDFLSKPFHPRELQLRLAKGVAFHQSRRRSTAPAASTPPTGTTLAGKYRLERQIAEGGMASVWLAVHLSLGINVAIKFMKPGLAETPDYASFNREARAAAQLRTDHVVRIYDHGIARDGAPYLVMEYLKGESLADRVERTGPMPPAAVAAVVEQIGRALAEAHGKDVIHRDIKPENILLLDDPERPHGIAKLVDFGLARTRTNAAPSETGLISGTPSYMSPEHLRGQAAPSPALDLWGLAATAFTALTAKVPFDGTTISQIVRSVCFEPLPVPSRMNPDLPLSIDTWFAEACARDPAKRFLTPGDLARSFARACVDAVPTPQPSQVQAVAGLFARTELEEPCPPIPTRPLTKPL